MIMMMMMVMMVIAAIMMVVMMMMIVVVIVIVVAMSGGNVLGESLRFDDRSAMADDRTESIRFGAHSVQRHIALVQTHHVVLGLHAGHRERNTTDRRAVARRRRVDAGRSVRRFLHEFIVDCFFFKLI